MSSQIKTENVLHDKTMVMRAIKDSFVKLAPQTQVKNPVMFLVFVSAILTTILWVASLFGIKDAESGFILGITLILWFTCLPTLPRRLPRAEERRRRIPFVPQSMMWKHIKFLLQIRRP